MKPLKVDFAPRRRAPASLWLSITLIALGVSAQQGWQAWQARERLQSAKAQVARLIEQQDQAQRARRAAESRPVVEPPYARDLAALSKAAAFPLAAVFASVEAARVPGVRVTALEASPAEGTVRAELEFSDLDALGRYVGELNAGEPKPRWTLQGAKTGAAGAPGTASVASTWP